MEKTIGVERLMWVSSSSQLRVSQCSRCVLSTLMVPDMHTVPQGSRCVLSILSPSGFTMRSHSSQGPSKFKPMFGWKVSNHMMLSFKTIAMTNEVHPLDLLCLMIHFLHWKFWTTFETLKPSQSFSHVLEPKFKRSQSRVNGHTQLMSVGIVTWFIELQSMFLKQFLFVSRIWLKRLKNILPSLNMWPWKLNSIHL